MYKVKLHYITNSGFEWLEKEMDVNYNNFKGVVKSYYNENEPISQSLIKKWKGNGEDVCMWINVDNIDAPQDLFVKIYNYVDDI